MNPAMRSVLVVSFIFIVIAGALPRTANALTASPIRIELNSDPGKTVSSQFKLYNDGKTSETYYIVFENFEAKGEDGSPTLVPGTDGLARWMSTTESITINPKESKTLPLTIAIPKDAEPGGYFAAILASTIPPTPESDQNVLLEAQVGTLVLLQVNGDFKQGVDILEFGTTSKKHWFTALPIELYYRFQNAGDSWVKPIGDIIARNWFGKTTKVIPTNEDRGNILPRSIRKFTTTWYGKDKSGQMPKGFWKKVGYEWNNFAFGKYSMSLNLAYGNSSDQAARATTSVWIFPWHLLLAGLVAIVLVFGISISLAVVLVMKLLKRRK